MIVRTAIVASGVVENIVLLEDGAEWSAPVGAEAVPCPDEVGPGWAYDGAVFTPPAHIGPIRVSKADFQRLLKAQERYNLNALRKVIAALQPEDYADPANALTVAAEDVMFAFEQPLEFIELNHPETAQGLELLAYLDVIAPERVAEIIGNVPPV